MCAGFQESLYIDMDWFDISEAYIFYYTSYYGNMFHIFLHKMHLPGPAGCEFIAYASGSGEKIKNTDLIKADPVVQDIKKTFTGKISSWPGFKTLSRSDPSTLVFTADYSQLDTLKRLMNLCNSRSLKT